MTTLTKNVQRAGTSRQESKATTRGKILEAAKSCFGTLGYERSTIRDIANTAGMSTGAIFASFAGKVELYAEIYGHAPISAEVGRELLDALRQVALAYTLAHLVTDQDPATSAALTAAREVLAKAA